MQWEKRSCFRCSCCGTTQPASRSPGPSHNRPLYPDGFGGTSAAFNHRFCCRDDSERPNFLPDPRGQGSTWAGWCNRRSDKRPVLQQVWPKAAEQKWCPTWLDFYPLIWTVTRWRGEKCQHLTHWLTWLTAGLCSRAANTNNVRSSSVLTHIHSHYCRSHSSKLCFNLKTHTEPVDESWLMQVAQKQKAQIIQSCVINSLGEIVIDKTV